MLVAGEVYEVLRQQKRGVLSPNKWKVRCAILFFTTFVLIYHIHLYQFIIRRLRLLPLLFSHNTRLSVTNRLMCCEYFPAANAFTLRALHRSPLYFEDGREAGCWRGPAGGHETQFRFARRVSSLAGWWPCLPLVSPFVGPKHISLFRALVFLRISKRPGITCDSQSVLLDHSYPFSN